VLTVAIILSDFDTKIVKHKILSKRKGIRIIFVKILDDIGRKRFHLWALMRLLSEVIFERTVEVLGLVFFGRSEMHVLIAAGGLVL